MRSPPVFSVLLVATLGACGQSLTPNKSGTGGATGTGTGGDRGISPPAVTGAGGSPLPSACNELVAEYQSTLTAAETCQVGASGQCQQLVGGAISGCGCSLYVTDGSALAAIQELWQTTGCAKDVVEPPCALCPAALNTTCVAADGGSIGVCSYVAYGTGGTYGTGGAYGTGGNGGVGGSAADGGPANCDTFATEYAAALIGAKSCTSNAMDQCTQPVPDTLSTCGHCTTYVNDTTVLDGIRQKWDAQGCGDVGIACPQIACPAPSGSGCVAGDAGGSVCADFDVILL